MILSVTFSPSEVPLAGAIASISSIKIIAGAACLAFLKISLILFSLSPTHLLNTSGPLTAMKLASLSVATALAKRVLPVPGGPYNKTPLGGVIPSFLNALGYFSGHSTASLSSCFTSSNPPMSSQWTFGTSMRTSLKAEGSTIFKAS
ncbi:146aa long hypothetical protein [Pyrococcus horikoshii OT3]|uniref:Uncharacterized protein n=1 Tax=Pyrococcus horikoshii (strain ATCC 700860 / DSM 12428 / JCM 9974 / NBRC 100139 / OT-3) TaxID=70601 RepID=O58420_PYRHO|nr:146aa long hypothetical protein [Pyrococcus horikoshii OT3]